MNNILLYIPVFLSWSLPIFVFKELTNYINNVEITVLNHLFWNISILTMVLFIFMFNKKSFYKSIDNISNIPTKNVLLLISMVLLSLVSHLCYYKLLKKVDVSELVPILKGVSTLLIVIVGYCVYKEKISLLKLFGILLIIIGIYIVRP